MTNQDWTLLVIAAAEGQPVSPVQLQKALFLIGRNLTPEQRKARGFYKFEAYDYGPFARAIYADAETLGQGGLVRIEAANGRYREYTPTAQGVHRAGELRDELDAEVVDYLDRVVQWVRSMPFDRLVRAIYREYPETKANSVFRG